MIVLKIQNDDGQQTAHLRLQQIENGYLIRSGKDVQHCKSLEEAADQARTMILKANWRKSHNTSLTTDAEPETAAIAGPQEVVSESLQSD